MKTAFTIALRFLLSNKGQTILISFGIAIGISVQFFIGSLITGLQNSLINTTIGNAAHISVVSDADNRLIENFDKLLTDIQNKDLRFTAIVPVLDQPGLIIDDERSNSIVIRGFDLERAEAIYEFSERIVEGNLPSRTNEAAIGLELANDLGVRRGDRINVTVLEGISDEFRITGIFDLEVQSINRTWFLTDIRSAQRLFDINDAITSIEIQVARDNVFQADTIAEDLIPVLQNTELEINNWKDQNASLLSGLNGQSISSFMIQFFVVISVVLGIASVLAISVMQKSKQIGILKAMGIKSLQSKLIFLFQGLLLGILGGFFGVAFGVGLAYSFTVFARQPDGSPVVALFIDSGFLLASFLLAVISSTIAALIPARKSAKLDPIEVIRNA